MRRLPNRVPHMHTFHTPRPLNFTPTAIPLNQLPNMLSAPSHTVSSAPIPHNQLPNMLSAPSHTVSSAPIPHNQLPNMLSAPSHTVSSAPHYQAPSACVFP